MLSNDRTNEATLTASRQLHAAETQIADGVPSRHILPRVLMQRDILMTLLDEAPEGKRRAIHRLLDEYDALVRRLAN